MKDPLLVDLTTDIGQGMLPALFPFSIAAAVAFHGLGVAAFHPEGSRAAALASGDRRATGMSIFSTGGNLGIATGPLVITPLVLAFGLKVSLVPLLPVLLVAVFLSSQLSQFAAHRPACPGLADAAPVPDRWGPFSRLVAIVMRRSVVYTGISSFLPLFFVGILGTSKARGATALLVPVGLALYLPFSVLVVMGQEYLPNRAGTASGVTLGLAVTAGGLSAPLLGLVADRWGLMAPLLVVSAIPIVAPAIALTLPDSRTVAGSSPTPV